MLSLFKPILICAALNSQGEIVDNGVPCSVYEEAPAWMSFDKLESCEAVLWRLKSPDPNAIWICGQTWRPN